MKTVAVVLSTLLPAMAFAASAAGKPPGKEVGSKPPPPARGEGIETACKLGRLGECVRRNYPFPTCFSLRSSAGSAVIVLLAEPRNA